MNLLTAYLAAALCAAVIARFSFAVSSRRIRVGIPTTRDRRRARIVAEYGLPFTVALVGVLWPAALGVAISDWFDSGGGDDPQDRVPPRWR